VTDAIVFPEYSASIVNLVASLERAYGLEGLHTPLGSLDPRSLGDRSALALVLLDGLGAELLAAHASRAPFLSSHLQGSITSVYPPTTAAAVTSFMSGMTPLEHGALGWSLYFKELGRTVDFLPFRDSVDGEKLGRAEHEMGRILRIRNVFERIASAGARTCYLGPKYVVDDQFADESSEPARRAGTRSIEGMFRRLGRLLKEAHRRTGRPDFLFCYCAEPDHTVHYRGTRAAETAAMVERLDALVERTARRAAGSGATIIVAADHGLIDTPRHLWLDQDPEVYASLIMPPFPEKRFLSFHVKAGRREAFPALMDRYREDFLFMSREELLSRGILGIGRAHPKVDDFLGDYVALGIGDAQLHTRVVRPGKKDRTLAAHHAGLRREEMLVPLVRIDL
jgi:hypothetical protein